MPIQLGVGDQKFFTDEFHAKTNVVSALVMSAVAFGGWMLGVWMGDLHTSSKAVHALGFVIALAGFVMTFFCAWLAFRAWVVQHRQ
jgi:hypothetical protein